MLSDPCPSFTPCIVCHQAQQAPKPTTAHLNASGSLKWHPQWVLFHPIRQTRSRSGHFQLIKHRHVQIVALIHAAARHGRRDYHNDPARKIWTLWTAKEQKNGVLRACKTVPCPRPRFIRRKRHDENKLCPRRAPPSRIWVITTTWGRRRCRAIFVSAFSTSSRYLKWSVFVLVCFLLCLREFGFFALYDKINTIRVSLTVILRTRPMRCCFIMSGSGAFKNRGRLWAA